MNVNIEFDEKSMTTHATFNLSDYKTQRNYQEALAIVKLISADHYVDPEMELEDFMEFVQTCLAQGKAKMTFSVDEEGLELEFLD